MIIIDGHNLLHSIKKVDEDEELLTEIQLCRTLSIYFKQIGGSGEVIFDGTGPSDKSGFDDISNLEVVFAGPGSDTDTVIEAKIKASTAPRRLTIVSSDRRLRRAAHTRKAAAVKSEIFWNKVSSQLARKRAKREPAQKRMGLSESETQHWLEIFDLGQ